jgi:membrane-associated PAP2 superfamily phosphatase
MIPYLLKIPFINDFIVSTGDFSFFVYLIFSLIFGFVFYHLVNLAFIVGGFLLGGLIGYSIGSFIISSNGEWLNNLPFAASYIPWIVFAVLGLIISIIFSKNYESIISTLSIIFGSFILSFYTIFLLEKYTKITLGNNSLLESLDQISQPEFYSIFITFIIYMVIGFYFSMRKNKKDKRIG